MTAKSRLALMLGTLVACVGCDQGTKELAQQWLRGAAPTRYLGGVVTLQYAENPGAFLSLGAGMDARARFVVFTVLVGLMVLGLAWAALRGRDAPASSVVALALMAGGGLGNWWDRVVHNGVVVDFMMLGLGPLHTGIFNVADVAIMAGGGVLLWQSRGPKAQATAGPPPPAAGAAPPG
ncbi:MAG: signal peptidase II [Deltaproteobacteria bacterium]|nr:signal peptidase II [Deltaproteobacteria bacterium]